MILEIHLVFFYTFTKVRKCGQHPGKMSRVGVGGNFHVFSFTFFRPFEHICVCFFFFWLEKSIIFTDGGNPPTHSRKTPQK